MQIAHDSESKIPIWLGGRLRKSPYFDATVRAGCTLYVPYNDMLLPLIYKDSVTDYWSLVNDVALWDVGGERQVEITGPDAHRFVQYLTPRNLSRCQVGRAKYVPLTNQRGGIINDPILLRLEENRFWLSIASYNVHLWAQGLAEGLGMQVTISEPDVSPLAIQGPKAMDVASDLLGDWVKTLPYFGFRTIDLDGIPMVVIRSGWSKQGGVELFLQDGQYGVDLWDRCMEVGQPYKIAPGAPSLIERIESGLLNFGTDLTQETNPFEVGLGKYVDLDQEADFLGKDALRQIQQTGITRKLVGIDMGPDDLGSTRGQNWAVYGGNGSESTIGVVTAVTHSPRLKRTIGYAMVAVEYAEKGTQFVVDTGDARIRAEVVSMPFIQPPPMS